MRYSSIREKNYTHKGRFANKHKWNSLQLKTWMNDRKVTMEKTTVRESPLF